MSGTQRRRIAGESRPAVQGEAEPEQALKRSRPALRRRGESEGSAGEPVSVPPPPPAAESSVPVPGPVRTKAPLLASFRSAKVLALVGLVVLSLAFAAFGVVTGIQTWRAGDISGARNAAEDAAATASETIFSYQYNKLPQHLSESEATMTPGFAKKFRSISPALNALAPQRRIRVKAVVRNAATIECGDSCSADKASVLIFIDQARMADGLAKPTVFGNRIQVSMVKRGNRWLVNDIKAL